MNSHANYDLVESNDRGIIVVAKKDFLPGELVIEEKEPILGYSNRLLDAYSNAPVPKEKFTNLVAYSVFCDLPPEKKQLLLSLYGPTDGKYGENMRNLVSSGGFLYKNRILSGEELETFVKVTNVARLNMFGDEKGHYIFDEVTRLAHSCDANCQYALRNGGCSISANRPIKAGEELTIAYVGGGRDILPTHERRNLYLTYKEFTCHCQRCDAVGDDTRQFDCIDPDCKGVMMVCQPINNQPILADVGSYTGVEYVEPHLLPCTECHLAAPADYQKQMLALEARLSALAERFATTQRKLVGGEGANKYLPLLAEIHSLKLPRYHLLCLPIFNTVMKIHRYSYLHATHSGDVHSMNKYSIDVRRAAAEYIQAIEHVLPFSHRNVYDVLYAVVSDCILEWRQYQELMQKQQPDLLLPCVFPSLEAKALLQKTLRMHLVLGPRETRSVELDTALLRNLEEIVHSGAAVGATTDVCAFCEESPQRAALTLSRCGKCKKVVYCSAGCQKAHWKLHKKTCKAT